MNSYRKEINAYIDGKKEEMLEDLKTLVRINSQKGPAEEGKPFGAGPAAVIAAAQEMLENYGFSVKNYENYVVAGDLPATEDASGQKGLDILAHLDVVPVTEDWTVTQPFEPKIVDGRIYGRGTADDKGPAIAALYAMRAIHDLGIPMKKGMRLVLGSDEECGSGDLAYYYGIEKEAPYTFTPDADFPLINIEKGRFAPEFHADFSREECAPAPRILRLKSGDKANVVPGRALLELEGLEEETVSAAALETEKETGVTFSITKEEKILKINARGQSAHASTPQEGKNALTATLRLVAKLFGERTPEGTDNAVQSKESMQVSEGSDGIAALLALERLFPYEDTCGRSAGIFREEEQSGALTLCFSILDYTPEHISGTFDARLPVGCTEENTRRPVCEALAAYGIELSDSNMSKPHCVPGDSAFVQLLLECYECCSGIKGKPLSTGGGTYVHGLERGVAFGCMTPDVDNHMHGDDEFMVIDTLLMSAKIFADAAVRICNEL